MPDLDPALITMATDYVTRIVGVVVALFIALIVAGWIRRLVLKATEKAKVDITLGKFFANAARYAVLTLAVIACLGVFGIETTSFAAVIGAAGLAIGLAFQGSLSNLASGVMLLMFRPFKVGDVVKTAGEIGKVDEIELFTTRLITPDNRMIIIPNSAVFGGTIENITFFDTRRVDVDVGTVYSADLDATRKVLEDAVAAVEHLPEPAPQVFLDVLGDSAILWKVRVWTNTPDYWAVREKLTRAIKTKLDAAGIGIPFPQMDVHLDPQLVDAMKRTA
ncbi:MAG: mechanosensitive ion channel family protein [Deltaproteobacteria bacterium]|nr:mechanosensitive ion channel family protein [Deltaproteobacteria bacterium]